MLETFLPLCVFVVAKLEYNPNTGRFRQNLDKPGNVSFCNGTLHHGITPLARCNSRMLEDAFVGFVLKHVPCKAFTRRNR